MKRVIIIYIAAMGFFSCLGNKQTPEDTFWHWFSTCNREFTAIKDLPDERVEELFDTLSEHLNNYCDGLTFEIGHDKDTLIYELVISADGNKEKFPQVESLVNSTPNVKNWKITALRQPKGDKYEIKYKGKVFNPETIFFLPKINPKNLSQINIEVVYPEYTEDNRDLLLGGTFLLIDGLIGERSTETDISYIDVSKTPDNLNNYEFYPLSELRSFIASKK